MKSEYDLLIGIAGIVVWLACVCFVVNSVVSGLDSLRRIASGIETSNALQAPSSRVGDSHAVEQKPIPRDPPKKVPIAVR